VDTRWAKVTVKVLEVEETVTIFSKEIELVLKICPLMAKTGLLLFWPRYLISLNSLT
jgi:hypothetical protein